MPHAEPDSHIVVAEYLMEPHLDRLRSGYRVTYDPDLYADRPSLLDEMRKAVAILVRNRTQIDGDLLRAAPALRVVGRLGVGLDNIDLEACHSHEVEVIPAIGANSLAVAEYVIGAMLVLVRGVWHMTPSMVKGEWPRQGHAFGFELSGKTLGLVGYGSIARLVASRAQALGMRVLAHDPYVEQSDPAWVGVERSDLEGVLSGSDFISLHAALTDETRNMIDADALALMRQGAILINTSRGGTVEQSAVVAALRSGQLGGAALDVFESEPLGPKSGREFEGFHNVILTPHVAGNTHEGVERVATQTVDAVLAFLSR